jgi:alpha-tubulin suppressor-like RCC1 family protein
MHACGLTSDGVAYCWGDNDWGQLGDGTGTTSIEPVPVTGAARFTTIAAGGYNTCALTVEGTAHCWGDNSRGQLGVPGPGPDDCVVALAQVHVACSRAPVPVVGDLSFVAIRTSCGLTVDGMLYCWGTDLPMPRDPPVAPSGPARVTGAPALDRSPVDWGFAD